MEQSRCDSNAQEAMTSDSLVQEGKKKYSRTSMARTSSGPWKFVRDMGSSSH